MAKRDKLYTVNKWNKPFFEEERRKRLYAFGDYLHQRVIPGLREGQAGMWNSYFNTFGGDAKADKPFVATQEPYMSRDTYTGGYSPVQESVKTFAALPGTDSTPIGKQQTNNLNWIDAGKKVIDGIAGLKNISSLVKIPTPVPNGPVKNIQALQSALKPTVEPVSQPASQPVSSLVSPEQFTHQGVGPTSMWKPTLTDQISNALKTKGLLGKPSTSAQALPGTIPQATTEAEKAAVASKIAKDMTAAKRVANTAAKTPSAAAQLGVNLAGQFVGDLGQNLIAPKMGDYTKVDDIIGYARYATPLLNFIPGGQWWLPAAANAALGVLSGIARPIFGGYVEGKDEVNQDIARYRGINPNGSNEYLANLLANMPAPRHAKGHNSLVNKSPEKDADRLNDTVDYEQDRFYTGIDNAIYNNNTRQLWNAYNDYVTYGAMGGRLNKKKKCNCKATGGFLNNAMLDSASATGYNFLSDLTNMQMQNNQNKQDMGSSLGNSFTGLSNSTLFANGGGININPAHKGEFTAKAKRHGMGVQQFANYVLAHKDKFPTSTIRQAVFAKNSNTWKKAFGGKLNYGKDQDIRNNSFFNGQTLYAIGGPLQAMSSNWSPGGNVTEINAGSTHEENPYQGVQVGVDPEGTPNLVEEGEVIFNDYVFSNRLKVPKEVCKELRVGQKKDGFTFAEVAKKLLAESKERPNDSISKRGLDANMQRLEDAQEELKQKMEAEEAVEQFNSLPPEQQVAIMQQEGEKAQDAVAQEQMAQEIQNLPPEQQQAIAQQMAIEQAQQQGMPQGMPQQGMSPEEQYAMQQQAMQDQAAQEQYAQQRDARNQQILAQAAAMQDQAINSSAMGGKLCLGGKMFAEGGGLDNTQPQAEPKATQQDTEMAKYSDEELQDMINEYQEAESGEVKVTKGKLARLRKKAEKAQAELERRHAEENAEQPQEARQEPTQEELQAAAQEQAMQAQQPIEGQPQGDMPQEGMSPEQAIMMQQQMGQMGQGSPEEMAAMQQQGQYGYGGKLYLTGGELFQALGFSEVDENNPPIPLSELGIKHLYDQIDPKNIKDVSKIYAKATDPKIKALFARGYDPLNPPENTDQWFEPTAGENIDWGQAAQFKANGYTRENLEDMAPYLPYLQDIITQLDNSGYNWDNNLMPQDLMKRIQKDKRWRDTNTYLKADQANRKDYLAQIYNRMDELGQEDTAFTKAWTEKWQDDKGKWHNPLGKFEFNNETGKYEYVLNEGMGDLFDQQFWAKRSDGLLGRMYNIRIPAQAVPQAYELDENGNPTGKILLNTDGYVQEGNTYSFYTKDPDNKYAPYINNQITYWKKKSDSSSSGKDGKSTLLQTKLNPQTNVTDYIMGALPGFTGLALQLGQGKPDMSGIEAAANAYANSMGAMAPVHLTHGLITPTLTSSWNNHNMLNAERLGVNRLLRNTGPAPSQAATIMANDAKYQQQMGQNDLRDIAFNAQQKKEATQFNENVARANATFLNQGDQFNAQMLANAGERYANARYNAEREKLAQENAWRAGILGNVGSMMQGVYNAYREGQNRLERHMLAASLAPQNEWFANYYGISDYDPDTGLVKKGKYKGFYYDPTTDKFSKTPFIIPTTATPGIVPTKAAQGGKLRKNKKRRGYTF